MRKHRGRLDASVGASGPHDFAVRLFAPFVKGAKASTASRKPNVRDDRETPLCLWARDGRAYEVDLGKARSDLFLRQGLDR
jgi:hypothetical protein